MKIEYVINKTVKLKDFLTEQNYSKKSLSAIKADGALCINGIYRTVRHLCKPGDKLTVTLPDETPSANLTPSPLGVTILYEDQFLCIVSKSAGISTMPSRLHPHDSLLERVLFHFQQNDERGIPHIVTRLDRNTSGIVVFAKHQVVHHWMTQTIDKWYLACTSGRLNTAGCIDSPIKRKSESIIERMVAEDGKPALTSYIALHRSEYSIALVRLHTGRTHQIRVHFASIGHPLLGDTLYGTNEDLPRQALHAFVINFKHPYTHKVITIVDRPPKDLSQYIPML